MNFGLFSYTSAAVAYGLFAVMLLFSWRASLQGKLLTVVTVVSTVWAVLAAITAVEGTGQIEAYKVFDVLRYVAWYIFLLKLFDAAMVLGEGYRRFVRRALPVSVGFAGLVLLDDVTGLSGDPRLALIGHIFLALIGLAIIEQLYRNTSPRHRWATKYLILGTGGVFAYDFYFYTDTLLFRGVDQGLWEARGIVHVVAVPLLALAAVRNRNWSLNVFVSRDIVLNTSAIMAGGIYLLVMAAAGFYLREFGGEWGRVGQVLFLALAVAVLAVLLFSRQIRSQARVFLGKHFFRNKYDYRVEWLRLTEKLSSNSEHEDHYRAALEAMANTVEARAGMLWLRDEQSNFSNVTSWNSARQDQSMASDEPLIRFFNDKGYIVNLKEVKTHAGEYEGLELPQWLSTLRRPWLIIPLFGSETLIGFVVLANPLVARDINWEDRDLLTTAAKQVTSYLMVIITSNALAEAKQFEVFSRLSAYMVHDLKNIVAELELVSSNAKKHIGNPEFVKDAFGTVDNAAGDINRLLDQLRNRRANAGKRVVVDLNKLLQKVVNNKQQQLPHPVLNSAGAACFVTVEKDRLANVVAHLIDNAQQATEDDGFVEVSVGSADAMQVVEIRDSGNGMDADFIRNRLFKPFDTTKGNAGMGIGMYESREFIRQQGGDIHVLSEPGKGTTISLHIPASQDYDVTVANA